MRTSAILVRKLAIVCLLCALGRDSCICGEIEKYDDELTGIWVMERVVYGAPSLSAEEAQPLKDPITVTYSKGWYLWESRAKGKRYFKYKCDRSKSPREFDAWRVENEEAARNDISRKPDAWGIYEIRDGHLWCCFARAEKLRPPGVESHPETERPKNFEVLDHEGYILAVHRRRGKVVNP